MASWVNWSNVEWKNLPKVLTPQHRIRTRVFLVESPKLYPWATVLYIIKWWWPKPYVDSSSLGSLWFGQQFTNILMSHWHCLQFWNWFCSLTACWKLSCVTGTLAVCHRRLLHCGPHCGPHSGPHCGPHCGPHSGPLCGPYCGPYCGPHSGPYCGPYCGPHWHRYCLWDGSHFLDNFTYINMQLHLHKHASDLFYFTFFMSNMFTNKALSITNTWHYKCYQLSSSNWLHSACLCFSLY